jgi:hypothetical protein
VIFVPEWPKGECVSFCVGYIMLDKITSMYCCCFHRDAVLFRVYTSVMIIKKTLYIIQISQFSSLSAVRTLICQSFIRLDDENFPSGRPSVSRRFEQVQGCIRPDVMVNRPNAHQSSRRSQCSSASVQTMWLYCPDAIQCLTSIRVSASRQLWKDGCYRLDDV